MLPSPWIKALRNNRDRKRSFATDRTDQKPTSGMPEQEEAAISQNQSAVQAVSGVKSGDVAE
jgi:hypothetical protein